MYIAPMTLDSSYNRINTNTILYNLNRTYIYLIPFEGLFSYDFGNGMFRTVLLPSDKNNKILNETTYLHTHRFVDKYDLDDALISSQSEIIFGDKYNFFTIEAIKKFNFNINDCYIHKLCQLGLVDILEYLKNTGKISAEADYFYACGMYDLYFLDKASANGHVDVLEWWLRSGLPLKYTKESILIASYHGLMDVLDWWKNSGLPLCHDMVSFVLFRDDLSENDIIDVLKWWYESGLQFETSEEDVFSFASEKGFINLLNWLVDSNIPVKCGRYSLYLASLNGHAHILEWWKNTGLPLKYDESPLNIASKKGFVHILEWWKNSSLSLKYSEKALSSASEDATTNSLKWWFNSGLPLKYNEMALYCASVMGNVNVLNVWFNSGLPLKYFNLPSSCHPDVALWWKQSGLSFENCINFEQSKYYIPLAEV
jgi:hypothetical protein